MRPEMAHFKAVQYSLSQILLLKQFVIIIGGTTQCRLCKCNQGRQTSLSQKGIIALVPGGRDVCEGR